MNQPEVEGATRWDQRAGPGRAAPVTVRLGGGPWSRPGYPISAARLSHRVLTSISLTDRPIRPGCVSASKRSTAGTGSATDRSAVGTGSPTRRPRSAAGWPTVESRWTRVLPPTDRRARDHGPGSPPRRRDHVFGRGPATPAPAMRSRALPRTHPRRPDRVRLRHELRTTFVRPTGSLSHRCPRAPPLPRRSCELKRRATSSSYPLDGELGNARKGIDRLRDPDGDVLTTFEYSPRHRYFSLEQSSPRSPRVTLAWGNSGYGSDRADAPGTPRW